MPRIGFRERRRRMDETIHQACSDAVSEGHDPGLRDAYPDIPKAPIRIIVPPMMKSINQGGVLRVAEAFRCECVDFEPEPDNAIDMAGGTGIWDWQPRRWIRSLEAIAEARASGYQIVGVTLVPESISVDAFDWQFPCAIVLGEERMGLSAETESLCDGLVAIPMYGMSTSINVGMACAMTVSAAIKAYVRTHPEFQPARNGSRRLLGLEPITYSEQEPEQGL